MSVGAVRLGLRENLAQFSLLVTINAFVGAMVGLERSTLPLIGEQDFGLGSSAAVLSFIVAFGLAKAFTNLGAGAFAQTSHGSSSPATRCSWATRGGPTSTRTASRPSSRWRACCTAR